MLINANTSQIYQPVGAMNDEGTEQGLPKGKPFSELFSSMYTSPETKTADVSRLKDKSILSNVAELTKPLETSSLLQSKPLTSLTIDSEHVLNGAALRVDSSTNNVNLDALNIDDSFNLPGLVNLNDQALATPIENQGVENQSIELSSTGITDVSLDQASLNIPVQNPIDKVQQIKLDSATKPIAEDLTESATQASLEPSSIELTQVGMQNVASDETLTEATPLASPVIEAITDLTVNDISVDEDVLNLNPEDINNTVQSAAQAPAVSLSNQSTVVENNSVAENINADKTAASTVQTAIAGTVNTATTQQVATSSVIQPTTQSVAPTISSATNANASTQWSTAGSDTSQSSSFSQNNQSNAQTGSQNSQSQSNSSQNGLQQFVAAVQQPNQFQEKRAQGLEQQMAVKTLTDSMTKADGKESLLTNPISGESRSLLPSGLQSIAVPVRSPQWGQALGQRVTYMANNQVQKAEITLNPEKLGPVQVKLHIDKDQQAHVTMNAQHVTTREAMESAIPRLREMLEQSGINLASVDVGDHSNFAQSNQENDSDNIQLSQGDTESDLIEQPAAQTTIISDNIVDFYA